MGGDDPRVSIDRVCDIEETLWSPRFGLKGKIDATVGIRMNDDEEYVIPFEIKSGKMLSEIGSIDHRAQVGRRLYIGGVAHLLSRFTYRYHFILLCYPSGWVKCQLVFYSTPKRVT